MRRSWRLVVVVVVLGLAASACSPEELAEIFNVSDLSISQNPVKVAAGNAAEAKDQDRAAQQLADEGLREKSKDKLLQAREARPRDPRYEAYLAAYELANGHYDKFRNWIREAGYISTSERNRAIESRRLDRDSPEARRIARKADVNVVRDFIEAVDWALAVERGRSPVEKDRVERLENELCKLRNLYLERYFRAPGGAPVLILVGGAECAESE